MSQYGANGMAKEGRSITGLMVRYGLIKIIQMQLYVLVHIVRAM
jgi:peptidoglycan hydrolase-like amidase